MPPPSIPIAVVIIGAAAAVTILAMVALRRLVGKPLLLSADRGASLGAVAGQALAILLAFIIVSAFQTYTNAQTSAQKEATASLQLFRTAGYFTPETRDTVRADLVCYGRAVAYSEWPAMREGHTSPLVVPWIIDWNDALGQASLRTARERLAFAQFGVEDDARTDAGVARFRESSPSVPDTLWFVLIFSLVLAMGIQLGLTDPRERLAVQGGMVGALAALFTTGLLLVSYLDHPYSGRPGSIGPEAMVFTLDAMSEIQPELEPPCDAVGRPIGGSRG